MLGLLAVDYHHLSSCLADLQSNLIPPAQEGALLGGHTDDKRHSVLRWFVERLVIGSTNELLHKLHAVAVVGDLLGSRLADEGILEGGFNVEYGVVDIHQLLG